MNTEITEPPMEDTTKTLAVIARPVGEVGAALPPEQIKPPVTAAQAKIEAVANLTMQAYQKAAMLVLTREESDMLRADFPDEAFQPGAAGKENLIYIEHAHLRDRFTEVFGMGQWAIIPRNRWNESFRTAKGVDGERIYVEAMLVVRGCFVGEAVGAMEYYPKNDSQNYGDAVEGAKTAAFRRCAKEFGVGLQAWKKEWVDGWWQRRRAALRPPRRAATEPAPAPAAQQTAAPKQSPPPAAAAPAPAPKLATDLTRTWMIQSLKAAPGQGNRDIVTEYFQKAGVILPNEQMEDVPLTYVPVSREEMTKLVELVNDFANGGEAKAPIHHETATIKKAAAAKEPKPEPKAESKPVEVPRNNPESADDPEPWRSYPMPFGKYEGTPLEELDKKYLYGLWANFTVETEYNGRPKKADVIERDEEFRAILDEAGEHYDFTKND